MQMSLESFWALIASLTRQLFELIGAVSVFGSMQEASIAKHVEQSPS